MGLKALFLVISLAIAYCPAQGLPPSCQPSGSESDVPRRLSAGPGVVDWKISNGAAT